MALIAALARRAGGCLFCDPDGHLSLSQVQIAAWTLAIGAVVMGHSLIKLDLPAIPQSLIALMGLSLTTGGVAHLATIRGAPARSEPRRDARARLSDLISDFGPRPELSLARAQMLFWTALMLVVFVLKSVLEGVVWAVPWEMVALMGLSQAGYLAPKLAPQLAPSTQQPGSGATG